MGKYSTLTGVLIAVVVVGVIWWKWWDSFLVWAVEDGDELIVKALLATRASVDATYLFGETALFVAAQKGDESMVKLLLSRGATVNATNRHKVTPLSEAARKGHLAVVRALLSAGANPTLADTNGKTARDMVPPDRPEIAQLLEPAPRASETNH